MPSHALPHFQFVYHMKIVKNDNHHRNGSFHMLKLPYKIKCWSISVNNRNRKRGSMKNVFILHMGTHGIFFNACNNV